MELVVLVCFVIFSDLCVTVLQSVGMIYITTESQDIFQLVFTRQPDQVKTPLQTTQGYKFDLLVPLGHFRPTNHWELEWTRNTLTEL